MKLLVFLLTVASLTAASPALACTAGRFNPISAADAVTLPDRMVTAAAYVDVAVAERRHEIDLDLLMARRWRNAIGAAHSQVEREDMLGFMRRERAEFASDRLARVQFRSVERIKGAGPAVFLMTAFTAGRPGYDLSARNAAEGRGYSGMARPADSAPNWVQAHRWTGVGACAMPLWVQMGERYLVFRSADGTLLGERPLKPGDMYLAWGPGSVFEPVSDTAPWLARVRAAARKAH